MGSELILNLVGNPVVTLGGHAVTGFQSSKAQALLYYLAVVRRQQSRAVLANLLWGDVAETSARRSLTAALSNLRRLLGDYVAADREQVAFRRDLPYRLDVEILENALDAHDMDSLRQVVDLYQGDFLEGFHVRNTPEFELWIARERARLRERFVVGLDALASHDATAGKLKQAIRWTRRMLQIEPWREQAHRNLMRYLAQDGQRGAALAWFEECRKRLAAELSIEPDETTLALVQQIRAGQLPRLADAQMARDEPPPVQPTSRRSLLPPPHNLPPQLTPFVGRRHESTDVVNKLCDPTCRLLTVVGPGGMGKTRLALHVAQSILGQEDAYATFEHGIYFVSLLATTEQNELIAALAEATGFQHQGAEPPAQQLIKHLVDKKMLLILDNFEQYTGNVAIISDLLRQAPTLTLLLTSRKSLNLQEAWVYSLQGLAYPADAEGANLMVDEPDSNSTDTIQAGQYDAVQLFTQCAQKAQIGFALDDQLDAVVRICQLVDGLPLAIELAASWLRVMPIADIAAEIERGLDILTARFDNITPRHRSIRVVLEQAWQMLAPREQAIFMHLSVFHGGFQRNAAQAVAGAALMDLAVFVEKSLLQMTPQGRYHIHELLRQFAAEQLDTQPAVAQYTRTLHSRYYLAFLAGQAERLVNSERALALNEVGAEIDNIRAAWLWAGKRHEVDAMERAMDSLVHYYWVRRRGQEGKEMFVRTLATLPKSNPDAASSELRMNLLRKLGLFHYYLGEYQEAYRHLGESMTLARRLGRREAVSYALNITGSMAGWQGNIGQALAELEEALSISRSLRDEGAIIDHLQQLALFTAQRGEYARATELVDESIEIARQFEPVEQLADGLHIRGTLCFYAGRYEEAKHLFQEAHALFTELKHSNGISLAMNGQSSIAWAQGGSELVTAKTLCMQSLQMARGLGYRLRVLQQLVSLAYICCDLGEVVRAQECAQEALVLANTLSSKIYQAYTLCCLGKIACEVQKFEQGKGYLKRAIQIASDADLQPLLVLSLFQYARLRIQEATQAVVSDATAMKAEALTLLALIEAQPACWHLVRARAGRLRDRLAATLSDTTVMAAVDRAQHLSPSAAAYEIVQKVAISVTAKQEGLKK